MQRDRLMTGAQSGSIDFTWLTANLEIGQIKMSVDEEAVSDIDTFVLGPKAYNAAETYVLALFHLYPTVYLHKTTRAAEKLFSVLMLRLISLVRDDSIDKINLQTNHPLIRFAQDSNSLDNALALDDTVFWGAIAMIAYAEDECIRDCANRLLHRRLPKCIDVCARLVDEIGLAKITKPTERVELKQRLERLVTQIDKRLHAWAKNKKVNGVPRILTDRARRDPYKRFQDDKGPLNQIHIHVGGGKILDAAECSPVIAALEPFDLFRAYVDENDQDAKEKIESIVREELGRE
jgi:HD superfamily phosphohydrolase